MSNILRLLELQQLFRQRIKDSTAKNAIGEIYHTYAEFTKQDWLDAASKIYGPLTEADLDVTSYWATHHEDEMQDLDAEILHGALIGATQLQKEHTQNIHISIWTTQGVRGVAVTIEDDVWRQRLFCNGKTIVDETAPLKEVLNTLQ